jgi:hypothetical protein
MFRDSVSCRRRRQKSKSSFKLADNPLRFVRVIPFILGALPIFAFLVLLRLKVMEYRADVSVSSFHFGGILRMLLRVIGSLVVPGHGQAIRGRVKTAFIHFGIFTEALIYLGEAAFLFNLVFVMERAFT